MENRLGGGVEAPDLTLILEFQHRLRGLAGASDYGFVYDALALIREFIPCREIGIDIIKPADENPDDVRPGCMPLWISSQWMAHTVARFMAMATDIAHVRQCAQDVVRRLLADQPLVPHSLSESARQRSGLLHYFYTAIMNISDVVDMAGLLGRYQLFESPRSRSFHVAYISVSRDGGGMFDEREKQLVGVFFNLFVDHFRHKIACTESHRFLPIYTDIGLKPRDLATVKACFDLRLRGEPVSRAAVAAILGKTENNVDDSIKRIRKAALQDFDPETGEYRALYKEFGLPHFADVFKTYAYFGFYPPAEPPGANRLDRFTSHLSEQLAKLR